MKSTYITNTTPICKHCLKELDGATDMFGDATPGEGDLSVCLYCQTLSKYDKDLNLTPLTDIEINVLKRDHPETYVDLRKIIFVLNNMDRRKFEN